MLFNLRYVLLTKCHDKETLSVRDPVLIVATQCIVSKLSQANTMLLWCSMLTAWTLSPLLLSLGVVKSLPYNYKNGCFGAVVGSMVQIFVYGWSEHDGVNNIWLIDQAH